MRLVGLDPQKSRHVVIAAGKGIGNLASENIEVDGDWERHATKFQPPPRDIANTAMFYVSQSDWFVKHILANDRVYFPIRDLVVFLRTLGATAK